MQKISFSLVALLLLQTACASHDKSGRGSTSYQGHGVESISHETLEKFAPKPLPKDLEERVRKMLEVQTTGGGIYEPNSKSLVFGWGITGTYQAWKLRSSHSFPEQMTSGNDRTAIVDVTEDGKYIVLQRDHAGEENPGLYLQKMEGGPLIEVQHRKGIQTQFQWSSLDGRTIYFTSNDIKPDSYALYSYDIPSKKKELLLSEPGLWYVSDVVQSLRGPIFLLGLETGALTREFFRFEPDEKKLIPVLGQNEKEQYRATFGNTSDELFVLTPKFGDFKRLYRFRAGKFTPITPDVKKEVDFFSLPYNHSLLYVQWNDGGRGRVEVLDPKTFQRLPFPAFKDAAQVVFGNLSRMGRFATLLVESETAPRMNYLYDWKNKKLSQWVLPSMPEVDRSTFVGSTLESYPARDGTSIPMLVSRPKDCESKVCPVVVHFHGGPEGQSRPGFRSTAQLFLNAGFIFVEPNVRGSEGYGKAWLHSDDGPKRLNVITDVEDCARYIRSAWARDGRAPKIGVMGWSYGGYETLIAMSMFAGSYDAGVALVGMSNLRTFLLNTAPYRRMLRATEYGDPEKDREALEKLSALNYLDRVKDPLMIVQGASDPRVPVGEALQMHAALESRGIESPLVIFADEGHGAAKRDNRVLELGHTIEFFQKHLNLNCLNMTFCPGAE